MKKFKILMFDIFYILNIYNLEKSQLWESKQST
jgi:hypothetical protein